MRWRLAIYAALGIYCLVGVLLIAQNPGLQYDEALLVAGAVHLRHSATAMAMDRPADTWICAFHHCIPLMTARYVGSVKEFLCLPFFAAFGPRTAIIRLVSLLLSVVGIWGLSNLIAEQISPPAAAAVALILAINPTYTDMAVFDNGAIGVMMAGLGLVCASLALFIKRRNAGAAFWFGVSMGFGVWARANFVWTLAAGGAAALIVFRRRILTPAAHWIGIAAGGIVGGFPFLLYQVISGGATWKARALLTVSDPLRERFSYRLGLLPGTLLSDAEHRLMWSGPVMPRWQFWLFPIALAATCLVCLTMGGGNDWRRRESARFAALACLFLGAFLFFSRLQVAEHHLIAMLPLAAVVVVVGCSILQAKYRWTCILSAILTLVYSGAATYWQVAAIHGLRNSGGLGPWSSADRELAQLIDHGYPNREIRILDWGLEENLYVLTDGRLRSRSIYSPVSEDFNAAGEPWSEEIQRGGVFLINGPENRNFPRPSTGFLRALAKARPMTRRYSVTQSNGTTYAEIIEVQPNCMQSKPP